MMRHHRIRVAALKDWFGDRARQAFLVSILCRPTLARHIERPINSPGPHSPPRRYVSEAEFWLLVCGPCVVGSPTAIVVFYNPHTRPTSQPMGCICLLRYPVRTGTLNGRRLSLTLMSFPYPFLPSPSHGKSIRQVGGLLFSIRRSSQQREGRGRRGCGRVACWYVKCRRPVVDMLTIGCMLGRRVVEHCVQPLQEPTRGARSRLT